MAILVTGGAGFIGSHTTLSLLENGYSVIVLDNFSNSNVESIKRVARISEKEIPVYKGDIRDRDLLRTIFKENKIDVVIHFAGLKSVAESISQPIHYYNNNITGTLVLTEEMLSAGVKKLIFSSSATVYGCEQRMPIKETHSVGGTTNPYGYSKLVVENLLKDVVLSDSLDLVILRYFNPIGAHDSGMIGENPSGIPNNIMPYITQVALGRLKCLSVFGDDYPTPDGTGVRDYVHVMDLAEGHVAALNYILANKGIEVFNLGTGNGYSVRELISTFEKVTGLGVLTTIAPRRSGDVAESWANVEKAAEILGWRATRNLEVMVEDSWRWQSKNPNGFC
jgi:UDP-glucose 4-epimerase